MAAIGRNDPCPCGSGTRYKKCCQAKAQRAGPRVVDRDGEVFVTSDGVSERDLELASEFFEQKRRGQGPAQQMADFSKPLLDAAGDDFKALQNAFSLGALFWNLALVPDEAERAELLTSLESKMATDEERAELRRTAAMMVERHKCMFPELHEKRRAWEMTELREAPR